MGTQAVDSELETQVRGLARWAGINRVGDLPDLGPHRSWLN
jgi:hypothetical protein